MKLRRNLRSKWLAQRIGGGAECSSPSKFISINATSRWGSDRASPACTPFKGELGGSKSSQARFSRVSRTKERQSFLIREDLRESSTVFFSPVSLHDYVAFVSVDYENLFAAPRQTENEITFATFVNRFITEKRFSHRVSLWKVIAIRLFDINLRRFQINISL